MSGPGCALEPFMGNFSLFCSFLGIPQFGLLSYVCSLKLFSGHLGPVLTLSTDYAAHTSMFSRCLLVGEASVWQTSPLAVAVRHLFCIFFFFSPPGYVAIWDSKAPLGPACEKVSYCVETPPSGHPPQDGSPSLNLLSFFLSFTFCPTSFQSEWTVFLGAGVLCQCSEVVLWKLLSIQMILWWICEG